MKQCMLVFIILIEMHTLTAQSTPLKQRLQGDLDLGYSPALDGSDLGEQANSFGFGGSLQYAIGGKSLQFTASPYVFLRQGKSLEDMKLNYKAKSFILTEYNSGTYFSSGLLMGIQYTIPTIKPSGLPAVHIGAQYGFMAAHVPAMEATYDTQSEDGITMQCDAAAANGTAYRIYVDADILISNNTMYSVSLALRSESADIPYISDTSNGDPVSEIYLWRGYTAQLGLGIALWVD